MPTISLQKPLLLVALITALLLAIPAIAMLYTSEVSWGPGDFLIGALLLFGAGALIVLSLNHFAGLTERIAVTVGVLLALAVVWVELSVGIFT